MKSLRGKILFLILVPVILVFLAIGSYMLMKFYNTQTQSAVELTKNITLTYKSQIETELNSHFKVAEMLVNTVAGQVEAGRTNRSAMEIVLRNVLEANKNLHGVWIGFEPNAYDGLDAVFRDAEGHDATGRFIPHWYRENGQIYSAYLQDYNDLSAGAYYQLALRSGQSQMLDPFFYEVNGKSVLMTTIAIPIKHGNEVIGVAGVDLSTEYLGEITSQLKIYENGFGRIITDQGLIVYHPQAQRIGAIGEEFQTAEGMGVLQEAQKGISSIWDYAPALKTQSLKTYAPIQVGDVPRQWIFGAVVQQDEMYAESVALMIQLILISAAGILLLLGLIVLVARMISKPITRVTAVVEKVSSLDLRSTHLEGIIPYLNQKDEVGMVSRALVTMQEALVQVTTQLQEISSRVAGGSSEIAASLGENSAAIEEVTSSMGELGFNVTQARDRSMQIEGDAKVVEHLTEDGHSQMARTLQAMNQIVTLSRESRGALTSLSKQVATMDDILRIIADVADQTNLLALNAAIEAARAGEYGRGFAVVADEVRGLAEQTRQSVGEISKMVNTLIQQTSNSTRLMDGTEEQIGVGSELLSQTETTFNKISQHVQAIGGAIQEFTVTLGDMNDMGSSVAAAAEEQAASMGEIAKSTEVLSDLGKGLQEIAGRFLI